MIPEYSQVVGDDKVETSVACTWESGDEPCPNCPRKITCLHKCLLLQDELKQVTGD